MILLGKISDLSEMVFGKLKAIENAGTNKHGKVIWRCICECGNTEVLVVGSNLTSGNSKQCKRCRGNEMILHHFKNKRIHNIWNGMRARCYNENHDAYCHYGGRGIIICSEWLESEMLFEVWCMESGYKEDLTIDRIDVNGNYEPENCRWATQKEQCNNKRNNVLLSYRGRTQTVFQWEEELGVGRHLIQDRIARGETDEEKIFAKYIKL